MLMKEPERIVDKIFTAGSSAVGISCPQCLEQTETTIDALEANPGVVCSNCKSVRTVDVEDLLNRRRVILNAMVNKTTNFN